jgi:hypothetical protein
VRQGRPLHIYLRGQESMSPAGASPSYYAKTNLLVNAGRYIFGKTGSRLNGKATADKTIHDSGGYVRSPVGL